MIASVVLAVALAGPANGPLVEPCVVEDGSGQDVCVWDARHMGNGEGRSFLIFDGGDWNMKVVYISHRRAHRLAGF